MFSLLKTSSLHVTETTLKGRKSCLKRNPVWSTFPSSLPTNKWGCICWFSVGSGALQRCKNFQQICPASGSYHSCRFSHTQFLDDSIPGPRKLDSFPGQGEFSRIGQDSLFHDPACLLQVPLPTSYLSCIARHTTVVGLPKQNSATSHAKINERSVQNHMM